MTSPALEFLEAAVRVDGPDSPPDSLGLDWTAVLNAAKHHRLLPLLYHRLAHDWPGCAPAEVLDHLHAVYQSAALRGLRQARRLVQLVDLLGDRGIACLCLKGPTLALQAYGDTALRTSTDLDILVRRADVPGACSALLAAGGTPEIALERLTPRRLARLNKHTGFTLQGDLIELHAEVMESGMLYPVPPDFFWQRAGQVVLLDRSLPVLSPDASLLMLCMQAAGDGWDVLRWPVDIAHLCRACPPANWTDWLDSARRWGMFRLAAVGLLLAADMGGAPLPGSILARCRADVHAARMAGEVRARLVSGAKPANGLLFYLRARERLRDRLFYVLDQSFVPKQVDWLAMPLPDGLDPLYYIYRPLRLAGKFAWLGLHKAIGKTK